MIHDIAKRDTVLMEMREPELVLTEPQAEEVPPRRHEIAPHKVHVNPLNHPVAQREHCKRQRIGGHPVDLAVAEYGVSVAATASTLSPM